MGSVFVAIVYFVSNKSLVQEYVLGTCCIFVYSVPIPISYLINESRVKDTIISSGWIEGFKSIFHSEETIREIRRQIFLNKVEHSKTSSNLRHEIEIGSQPGKLFHRRRDIVQASTCREVTSLLNVNLANPNESSSMNDEVNKQFDHHKGRISDCIIEDIELCTDTSRSVSGTRQQPGKLKVTAPAARFVTVNENVAQNQDYQTFLMKDCVIRNRNFKIFARKLLLQHLIMTLNNDDFELQYKKYLQCLNDFEKCLESKFVKKKSFDILSSLTNAWQLYQLTGRDAEIKQFDNERTFPSCVFDCTLNAKDLKTRERKHIVQLLLDNLLVDENFLKYLKLLNESSVHLHTFVINECCGENHDAII